MVRCFFGSSMYSVHVPSPLRRTLSHVCCVWLSLHLFVLSRICIAFQVVECIVAHGPEMRFMCLIFFYVSVAVTLTSCFFLDFCVILKMASVGGRRRKSAEEWRVPCSRPPDKSEDTATTLTRNDVHTK